MDNEQDLLQELLESSLSQVEDYAATIRETVDNNLAPDNIPVVCQMNSALLYIDELVVQLEHLVVMFRDKLKRIVPEPTEQSADDSNACNLSSLAFQENLYSPWLQVI